METNIVKCTVLGGSEVGFNQSAEGITIDIPQELTSPIDTIIKMELDKEFSKKPGEDIYFTGR